MKDWRECLHIRYSTEEELQVLCRECGIKKRVSYFANVHNMIKKYPVLKPLGYNGYNNMFVFKSDRINNILEGEYVNTHDLTTSFLMNVVLAKLNNELPEDPDASK